MSMTTEQIISSAGGVSAVAERTGRIPDAVRRWKFNGIPEKHWDIMMQMVPGLTPADIYAANEAVRTKPESEAAA